MRRVGIVGILLVSRNASGLTLDRRALQTRYVMKYRHCDGKLVLKVTDDRVV